MLRARHRLWILPLGLLLLGPTDSVAQTAPAVAADDDGDDFVGEDAWVKFKLTHGGKTHEHAGYLGVAGEEMVLSMGSKAGTHEVSITLDVADGGKWTAKVGYKLGDKSLVSGSQKIRTKKWVTFKSDDGKSKVQIHVDPDSDGAEDIELGKGKGPLDGLK